MKDIHQAMDRVQVESVEGEERNLNSSIPAVQHQDIVYNSNTAEEVGVKPEESVQTSNQ